MLPSWEELQTRARILIVDDDESTLQQIAQVFRNAGYRRVGLLRDSRTLKAQVEIEQPDLILLAMSMGGMDAYEVLEELRATLPEGTYLPIIALGSEPGDASLVRALVAGAKDIQSKPLDFLELLLRARVRLETRFQILDLQRTVASLRPAKKG